MYETIRREASGQLLSRRVVLLSDNRWRYRYHTNPKSILVPPFTVAIQRPQVILISRRIRIEYLFVVFRRQEN